MLSEILNVYKTSKLLDVLKSKGMLDINWDNEVNESQLRAKWRYVGDNPSNASTIQILNESEKGIIERLSNAIDSVLVKNKEDRDLRPKNAEDVLRVSYPNFFKMRKNIINGKLNRANVSDADDLVILLANDGDSTKKPTFDVIDFGTGIRGDDFGETILSIQGKNKISTKENYLIGSFGQGGSTSLKFAYITMIISKISGEYYFTVVHKFRVKDFKKPIYAFLVNNNNNGLKIKNDMDDESLLNPYLKKFIDSDSGTIVRMFDYEIDVELRSNEITKPIGLLSYINTQLYNVPLPVKLVDNRKNMLVNIHSQPKYSYGTHLKMMTSSNNIQEYNGFFEIDHHNRMFKVNYYIILPSEIDDWPKDKVCEKKFKEFSHHGKSIFYTVNGQYITHEHYTKIRNRGLMFLENRLLVEINLDQLEDKYDYFTSDRNQVIGNELSRGLLERVIEKLVTTDKLISLNNRIAEMTTKSKIDNVIVKEISEEVKREYLELLDDDNEVVVPSPIIEPPKPKVEIEYADEIKYLIIDNKKDIFEKSSRKTIFLKTDAKKYINDLYKKGIFLYIKSVQRNNDFKSAKISPKIMNGVLIYDLEIFELGLFQLYFESFRLNLKSRTFDFEIIEDTRDETKKKIKDKLNLEIEPIENIDINFICQVTRSLKENKEYLKVVINFGHEDVKSMLSGKKEDFVEKFKQNNIKPIALFALIMKDDYSNIDNVKKRNKMIVSLLKSINR